MALHTAVILHSPQQRASWRDPAAHVGKVSAPRPVRPLHYVDPHGQTGSIIGTTKTKNTPANIPKYALVRLYRDANGHFAGQTWSDPDTGAYEFTDLPIGQRYTVVAFDPLLLYRAVVADGVVPELTA